MFVIKLQKLILSLKELRDEEFQQHRFEVFGLVALVVSIIECGNFVEVKWQIQIDEVLNDVIVSPESIEQYELINVKRSDFKSLPNELIEHVEGLLDFPLVEICDNQAG